MGRWDDPSQRGGLVARTAGDLERRAPQSISLYALVPLTPELSCSRAIIISRKRAMEGVHCEIVECGLTP